MPSVNKKLGNAKFLCIMDTGTIPVFPTLAAWDGSTGNYIFLNCFSEEDAENSNKVEAEEFRSSDLEIYATDVSKGTGISKGKLYLQDMLTQTFMYKGVLAAIQAGKKILEIDNMGYKEAKWHESIKLGDITPQRAEIANNPSPTEYMFRAVPQPSAFTLSSANITAIKALGTYPGTIHCAGPHIIPAGDREIIVYT